MRQHPIGTGPFKFVEFKPNQSIKLVKNPDYWKKGRPYLDGIDFSIMREIAPRNLAFFAGENDVRSPYRVTRRCSRTSRRRRRMRSASGLGQRAAHDADQYDKPPFDNPELRRAMTLAIDRDAFFEDHQWRRERYNRRADAAAAERRLGHA